MRLLLSVVLFISSVSSFAQTQVQKDSLITVMCKVFTASRGQLADTSRIRAVFDAHLTPFVMRYPAEDRNDIGSSVFYRFQKNCAEFERTLAALQPSTGDWVPHDVRPERRLKSGVCEKFLELDAYAYREPNGDTVRVRLQNGYWIDSFGNGSYSKLKFAWIGECQFEIEFIESNNESRKGMSQPGDKYRYELLEKKQGYYLVLSDSGENRYYTFKLYY